MIYLGSDGRGFWLKEEIKKYLTTRGYKIKDLGPEDESLVEYPKIAKKVASETVRDPNARGILFSPTGQGMCIVANKIKGVYAAVALNEKLAEKARQINDTNLLCVPSDFVDVSLAEDIVGTWLSTSFSGTDHAKECLNQIRELENE